ncbi:hypothetical protein AMTRI_Chr10g232080 [Amborella trichopoda]|uniref:non-specific serine/threonine protein kinase n=1 Tax=Amborella trichopoda TaxID=13333 RepID=U5DFQ4_AMBTC|nr:probable L-type lectin-domain containing receptor kinase S.7 [Amborella trichopoda]ERN19258.1 hypothetical protein AMTR_s00061p00214150 [Amborella trichopoda]|eukprot:XP_006857791.1 probable L-type lectin-domain containing receptor kinase S.7 [Amborella trichopoda]
MKELVPTKLFLSLTFLLLHQTFAENQKTEDNISFGFASFSPRNITLLGDSYLHNGTIGLTRELGVPSSSTGKALYNLPVKFFDPRTNISAAFSTRFSFSISSVDQGSYGDGLAFFISSSNYTLSSSGGLLGLFNSFDSSFKNKFIAIEFYTSSDARFNYSSVNHVGLDVNSLPFNKTLNLDDVGIDLESGNLITAWVEYSNEKKRVLLWLSYSSFKPTKPHFTLRTDLSMHFEEYMYVGFSASREGNTELHKIEDWSFRTSGFQPKPDPSSNNISSNSWIKPLMVPPNSKCHKHPRLSRKLKLGLEITGSLVFCLFFGILVWFLIKKWCGFMLENTFRPEFLKGPRKFKYRELKFGTKGFHSSRILGKGSFGTVYKGILKYSGTIVAVKRSKKQNHEGKSEFIAELTIIAGLRHRNLVQLQGWCSGNGELLLVYEFMPNGSLDTALYGERKHGNPLPWPNRYKIAIGLASVLAYLHEECEQQVIHRDIKTSNVMLDADFNARLGDFGLAKLAEHDMTPDNSLTAGTMGYLAPEYIQYGKATEKTDIYSFGVVLLELCCGRRAIEKDIQNNMVNLVDWVWSLHGENRLFDAADVSLRENYDREEMRRLLLVGLSCAHPDFEERPTTRKVLHILNREGEVTEVPAVKPSIKFSRELSLTIDQIFLEAETIGNSKEFYELKIDQLN